MKKWRKQKKHSKKNPSPTKKQFNNTLIGRLSLHYEGYGFVIPDDPIQSDVFVPGKSLGNALPDDQVEVEIFYGRRGEKTEGRIVSVVKRGREEWIGTVIVIANETYVLNREFRAEYQIHIPGDKLNTAKAGDVVVCRITHFPKANEQGWLEGEITHVIGPEGEESTEIRIVLAKHKIPDTFPTQVIEEAKKLPPFVFDPSEKRVDLREKPFITIDGADARDFDDAILVEKQGDKYHLFVSIADVSHYVRKNSVLDFESGKRGNSSYFPRFAIPMLPDELSNDLCSLKENQDRPTLTCEMIYNDLGVCEKAFYYRSVIRSIKRCVYEDIAEILNGKKVIGYEVLPDLTPALELAKIMFKSRRERGALDFDLPEPAFIFDKNGNLVSVKKRERLFPHQLIEEFMIAANQAVAKVLEFYGIPLLYRVHDLPDVEKMMALAKLMSHLGIAVHVPESPHPKVLAQILSKVKGHPSEEVINQTLLRSLRVAIYSPENKGHYGLSLKHYCHFTSPIRRYPDLIIHRTLIFLLESLQRLRLGFRFEELDSRGNKQLKSIPQRTVYSLKDLHSVGEKTSKTERGSMEAEREMQDLLKAILMKKHLGETFKGIVRRVAKFGLFVELCPYFVEGLVHISELGPESFRFDEVRLRMVATSRSGQKVYKIGDEIEVQISEVDIPKRQIQLVPFVKKSGREKSKSKKDVSGKHQKRNRL